MPQPGNRVTLNTDVKDQHGLPVPNVQVRRRHACSPVRCE
jgi:hypothetical protein